MNAECRTYSLMQISNVSDESLLEVSGAAWDHLNPGVVWVHQDSANPPEITSIQIESGDSVARHTLLGHEQYDWEDMSLATSPDGVSYLFVGDIGDNLDARQQLELVRLPVPTAKPPDRTLKNYETLRLLLPTPANAEALLIDPLRGDVLIATKNITGVSQLFVAEGIAFAAWKNRDPVAMLLAGQLDLGLFGAVLAGDISPNGLGIVLRSPANLWYWPRRADQSVAVALTQNQRCSLPSRFDIYGEAVTLANDGSYLLLGEGLHSPIYQGVPTS